MALFIIRLLSLWIGSCIAIKKGVPSDLWPQKESCCFSLWSCCRRKKVHSLALDESVHAPIILDSGISGKRQNKGMMNGNGTHEAMEINIEGIVDQRHLVPQFESENEMESYEERKSRAITIKYGVLLVMFLLCTGYQAYIGVKCVQFDFLNNTPGSHGETFQALLYALIVICINAEIFLLQSLIEAATNLGDGILVPSLHPHPLKEGKKVYHIFGAVH